MTKSWSDIFKWVVVIGLVSAGIVGNSMLATSQPATMRLIAWIFLICVALFIASRTTQGKEVVSFAKQSRLELRKVVWPTRQETVQTTMIVVVMVTIVSLGLWLVDLGFLWAIALITGHRG